MAASQVTLDDPEYWQVHGPTDTENYAQRKAVQSIIPPDAVLGLTPQLPNPQGNQPLADTDNPPFAGAYKADIDNAPVRPAYKMGDTTNPPASDVVPALVRLASNSPQSQGSDYWRITPPPKASATDESYWKIETPPPTTLNQRRGGTVSETLPPANQYTAAPNQPTEQERLGEMVPQSAVPALTTAQKYLVTPFEKLSAGGRAAGEKTAEVLAPKPDLTGAPDWLKNAADVEQNIVRGVAGTVGATAADPRNWPFLASGAARPLLQHIISLGFTGMLSQQALHSAIDLHANWDKLTPGERAKLATDAGVAGMMAMGGAVNAINPRLAVGVNPEEVRVGIAANPLDTGPVGVEARFPRGGYKPPAGAPSAIEPPTIEGNAQPVPPRSPIGTTEPETGRPVLQQSARSEVTQAAATAEHPAVKDAISNIIKPIQGAELAGAREEKEPERLGEKIEDEGQSPRTVRDYSGYRIAVDSPTAKDQVVTALKQNFEVHGEQDHFNEGDPDHGFHAHTLNVREPGSPVSHEVQILPREVAETADANHELYEKARDGDAKATAELKAKNEETYQQFAARQEAPNALRQRVSEEVHERTQEKDRPEGGGRVQPGIEGNVPSRARTEGPETAKEEKPFKYRSTQVNIPAGSEAYTALDAARARISDSDVAGKGKDVGGNHLTVKYGLKAADDDKLEELKSYIASLTPFEATLGKTEKFAPTEHSEGAAVIQAPVNAPELGKINSELEKVADFKTSDFAEYKPHATVAYVDPAKADRYVGMNLTEGRKFPVHEIVITDRDGKQQVVKLEGKPSTTGTYFGPAATDSITGASKYPAQAGKGVGVPGETNAQVAAEKVATRQPGQPPVPPKAKGVQSQNETPTSQRADILRPKAAQETGAVLPAAQPTGNRSGEKTGATQPGISSAASARPALGIDFDGTLFKENPDGSIGAPIPERIASLKEDVAAGKEVKIESKRAGHPGGIEAIHAALESVGLPRLPVTAKKTAAPTLIDNEGIKEPGVEVQKVPTDANTPLPGTPERLEVPQSKSERHNEALRQAREKLGLKPGQTPTDFPGLSKLMKAADEIERGMREKAPARGAEVKTEAAPPQPEIVQRALKEPIAAIGQLSQEETAALNKAVKDGVLSKGKGGGYPAEKTVYAKPGFDFAADRKAQIDELLGSEKTSATSPTTAATPEKENLVAGESGAFEPAKLGEFAKKEYETEIKPALDKAHLTLGKAFSDLQHLIAPRAGIPIKTLDAAMKLTGTREKNRWILEQTLRKSADMFDKAGKDAGVAFVDAYKTAEKQPTPELQQLADFMGKTDEATYRTLVETQVANLSPKAQELWRAMPDNQKAAFLHKIADFKGDETLEEGPLKELADGLLNYKQDHFRVLWKTVPGRPEVSGTRGALGRRPLEGSKGFLRQSTLDTMSEGLDRGGEPQTYNPVRMFELAQSDAWRYITAQEMWRDAKADGGRVFVKTGQSLPEGFKFIEDKIGNVRFAAKSGEGMVQAGKWALREDWHRLLSNMLSHDYIRESTIGNGLMSVKNHLTAYRLSLSPFHAIVTSVSSVAGQVGSGMEHAGYAIRNRSLSNFVEAAQRIATSPFAPVMDYRLGTSVIRYATTPEEFLGTLRGKDFIQRYPDAAQLVDDLFAAGAKLSLHEDERMHSIEGLHQAVSEDRYLAALIKSPLALNQIVMRPLFGYYIPRIKLGAFLRDYSFAIQDHQADLDAGKMTRGELARKTWDTTENIFGQMNWDARWWNRTFKAAIQLAFRAFTWFAGNIRLVKDAGIGQTREAWESGKWWYEKMGGEAEPKPSSGPIPRVDPAFAKLVGLAAVYMGTNAAIQYAMTHEPPKDVKDLLAARVGGVDVHGNPLRIVTPAIVAKDALSLWAHGAGAYMKAKESDLLSGIVDVVQNEDFRHAMIHNPKDSWWKQRYDDAAHIVGSPIGISTYQRDTGGGESKAKAAFGLAGFSPAPTALDEGPLSRALNDLAQKKPGPVMTPEERQKTDMEHRIIAAMRQGDRKPLDIALANKKLSFKEAHALRLRANKTPLEDRLTHVGADDIKELLKTEGITSEERRQLERALRHKREEH